MKSLTHYRRTATITGAVLIVTLMAAFAMPAKAAYITHKAKSTARSTLLRLCTRFCGCHHHHHGHVWCGGHEDFWCPGHH